MSDLIITGIIDGPLSGGLPKAVEIYVVNDIPNLSVYGIGSANNGSGSGGIEFTFSSGSVSAGQYIYVATESPQFTAFFGFAPTFTTSAVLVNSDDAIELFQNGAVVDVFGEVDVDGTGEPWEYTDAWAYRKAGTGPDGTFVLDNWDFSGIDALDFVTSNGGATVPFPIGTYTTGGGTPTAGVTASGSPTEAGAVSGTFTISRGTNTIGNLPVYFTLGGTANQHFDYELRGIRTLEGTTDAVVLNGTSGSVIIPNGATRVTLTVIPKDDTVIEGNETLTLTLTEEPSSAPNQYAVSTTPGASLTLTDNATPSPKVVGANEIIITTNADRASSVFAADVDGDGDMDKLIGIQTALCQLR